MLKIAVCDDEREFINIIAGLIKRTFSNNVETLDTYTNPRHLLNCGKSYDLLFLDIDMPILNGIQLAKYYNKSNASIIFVTNKEALVFEAYNSTDSFGFIRKSRLTEDFENVIKRFNRNNQLMHSLTVVINSQIYKIRLDHVLQISSNEIILSHSERVPVSRNRLKYVKTEFLKRSAELNE